MNLWPFYQLNSKQEKYVLKSGEENKKLSKICDKRSRIHCFGKVAHSRDPQISLAVKVAESVGGEIYVPSPKPQISGLFKLESHGQRQHVQRERRWP